MHLIEVVQRKPIRQLNTFRKNEVFLLIKKEPNDDSTGDKKIKVNDLEDHKISEILREGKLEATEPEVSVFKRLSSMFRGKYFFKMA